MLKAAVINSGTRGSPRRSGEGMTGRRQVDETVQCCFSLHNWMVMFQRHVGGNCSLCPSLFVSDANVTKTYSRSWR